MKSGYQVIQKTKIEKKNLFQLAVCPGGIWCFWHLILKSFGNWYLNKKKKKKEKSKKFNTFDFKKEIK